MIDQQSSDSRPGHDTEEDADFLELWSNFTQGPIANAAADIDDASPIMGLSRSPRRSSRRSMSGDG